MVFLPVVNEQATGTTTSPDLCASDLYFDPFNRYRDSSLFNVTVL